MGERADWPAGGLPPMPARVEVLATVRDDLPVAVLRVTDVEGAVRELHLDEARAMEAVLGLVKWQSQMTLTRRGSPA